MPQGNSKLASDKPIGQFRLAWREEVYLAGFKVDKINESRGSFYRFDSDEYPNRSVRNPSLMASIAKDLVN